jgi:hypothetical protein
MTEAPRPSVQRNHPAPSGSGVGTFIAVLMLLAAVVGGAYYMNKGPTDQAAAPADTTTSSTGASTGEAGSDTSTKSSTEAPAQQP